MTADHLGDVGRVVEAVGTAVDHRQSLAVFHVGNQRTGQERILPGLQARRVHQHQRIVTRQILRLQRLVVTREIDLESLRFFGDEPESLAADHNRIRMHETFAAPENQNAAILLRFYRQRRVAVDLLLQFRDLIRANVPKRLRAGIPRKSPSKRTENRP